MKRAVKLILKIPEACVFVFFMLDCVTEVQNTHPLESLKLN